jgi:hypothetical protein
MVATHAPDRGLIFLWWDLRDSTSTIRARWLLSDGTSDPSEPDEGRLIDDPFAFGVMAAMSDGAGGVYVVWQKSYDEFTHRLYMSRLAHGTPLAVPEPLSGDGLALRVPNPARGALDVRYRLPDAAPARLELFDVSGRRLRALDVRGIGEGTARFERLAELRAGVYVIRLSQGREQRTARVAFLP